MEEAGFVVFLTGALWIPIARCPERVVERIAYKRSDGPADANSRERARSPELNRCWRAGPNPSDIFCFTTRSLFVIVTEALGGLCNRPAGMSNNSSGKTSSDENVQPSFRACIFSARRRFGQRVRSIGKIWKSTCNSAAFGWRRFVLLSSQTLLVIIMRTIKF